MSNSSRRLSRGDRRRNEKLQRLRAVVTRETAVLAFDLAADKQVLIVSLSTVRTHTQNIYAKLGVNNRRSAVRQAEELNLFSRTRDR
jgi:ATP/maltotriose-dependent transcriptional regulator MalT